jgi:hypothetical protein
MERRPVQGLRWRLPRLVTETTGGGSIRAGGGAFGGRLPRLMTETTGERRFGADVEGFGGRLPRLVTETTNERRAGAGMAAFGGRLPRLMTETTGERRAGAGMTDRDSRLRRRGPAPARDATNPKGPPPAPDRQPGRARGPRTSAARPAARLPARPAPLSYLVLHDPRQLLGLIHPVGDLIDGRQLAHEVACGIGLGQRLGQVRGIALGQLRHGVHAGDFE